MTQYSITLGEESIIGQAVFAGAQVVANGHGNGNALGNTLAPIIPQTQQETLAEFVLGLGHLEKGHTYFGTTVSDPDYRGTSATFIVTDTQSGKIGAISLVGEATVFNLSDHVLTFGA
jgi:hypothetical protein